MFRRAILLVLTYFCTKYKPCAYCCRAAPVSVLELVEGDGRLEGVAGCLLAGLSDMWLAAAASPALTLKSVLSLPSRPSPPLTAPSLSSCHIFS